MAIIEIPDYTESLDKNGNKVYSIRGTIENGKIDTYTEFEVIIFKMEI